jgi:hypothetical protein
LATVECADPALVGEGIDVQSRQVLAREVAAEMGEKERGGLPRVRLARPGERREPHVDVARPRRRQPEAAIVPHGAAISELPRWRFGPAYGHFAVGRLEALPVLHRPPLGVAAAHLAVDRAAALVEAQRHAREFYRRRLGLLGARHGISPGAGERDGRRPAASPCVLGTQE